MAFLSQQDWSLRSVHNLAESPPRLRFKKVQGCISRFGVFEGRPTAISGEGRDFRHTSSAVATRHNLDGVNPEWTESCLSVNSSEVPNFSLTMLAESY
jgi:hypothetical protein